MTTTSMQFGQSAISVVLNEGQMPAKLTTNPTTGATELLDAQGGVIPVNLGDNVLTVGTGGQYATLEAALSYLSALSGTDVWVETVGAGTIAVTQNSDTVTGTSTAFLTDVQLGDYVSIDGDGAGLATGTLCHTLWHIQSNTSLRLGTGFLGASGSGKAYSIWRPVKYQLLLLAGEHDLTSDHVLPQGMHLSITGSGKGLTTINIVGAGSIHHQRSNYLDFGGFSLVSKDSGVELIAYGDGLGYLDCGLGDINIHDIHCDYTGQESTAVGPALLTLRASSIRISNITGRCPSAFAVTSADYIEFNDMHFEAYNAGADCFQSTAYGAFSATKPWIYNNSSVIRKLAGITGGGAMFELNGAIFSTPFSSRKQVYITNLTLVDTNQQGNTNPSCMQVVAAMGAADIYLNNVVIDGVRGLNLVAGANVSVYGHNVTDLVGGAPNFVDTTTPYYAITNDTQSVAYAATITPKPSLGGTIVVGALTGNPTIAAPLYPVNGQELTFVFTQDGTGSRTITWNAVFKKAADGAGAASTKGATTFKYDGTNWMQVSGALAFN